MGDLGLLTGRWLITGGARAGKSAFAEDLALRSAGPVFVVATAEPFDAEMTTRIAQHRAARPPQWQTVEEPLALAGAVAQLPEAACVLIDCLTVWVGNVFHHRLAGVPAEVEATVAEVEASASEVAQLLAARTGPSIVVTNDVGLGLVPEDPLSRCYRDTLGRANAALARCADRVVFMSAGRAIEMHPPEALQ